MTDLEKWCEITIETIKNHEFKIFLFKDDHMTEAVEAIAFMIPEHYIDPKSIAETIERLGKPASAQKLRSLLPMLKKSRSSDLGEILASEYINNHTSFKTFIKKLRWKDHREMALRGDDIIGIEICNKNGTIHFLKTEVKSRVSLSTAALQEARLALDADNGKPSPHSLAFIAERLRELKDQETANSIEQALLVDGINSKQVKHLLFTLTQSNPNLLQKTELKNYSGDFTQNSVCLNIKGHQEFINAIFEKVNDDTNS